MSGGGVAALGGIVAWLFWSLSWVSGFIVTAFAATLGTPFWFDALNKVMVVRSTVKPKEKSGNEGTEDRRVGRPRGGH